MMRDHLLLFVLAMAAMFLLASCAGGPLAAAKRTANTIADSMDATGAVLLKTYEQEHKSCIVYADTKAAAIKCAMSVRSRYRPAWEALRVARHAWIALAGVVRHAEATQSEPSNDDLLVLSSALTDAFRRFLSAAKGTN